MSNQSTFSANDKSARLEELKAYLGGEYGHLIPCHRPDAVDIGKDGHKTLRGKTPIDTGWRKINYKPSLVVKKCVAKGLNVGVRLSTREMVIDEDPRNGGGESLTRFCADHPDLDLSSCPHVHTGGGGNHYYFRLPKGAQIVKSLKNYPGLDFKTFGGQVIAAGSIHPVTGEMYQWAPDSPDLIDAPELPRSVIATISKGLRSRQTLSTTQAGSAEVAQIEAILTKLNPAAFGNYDDWIALAMAIHYLTAGEAEDAFVDWSTGDPAYADHEERIRTHWASFSLDKQNMVGVGTLNRILRENGLAELQLPPDATGDFDTDFDVVAIENEIPVTAQKPHPRKPFASARLYRSEVRPNLLIQNDTWLDFNGRSYVEIEDDTIRSDLYMFMAKKAPPNKAIISNVYDALKAHCHVPRDTFKPPCWLDSNGPFPASEAVSLSNGILHLPSGTLIPSTPNFFVRSALSFAYDPRADKPRVFRRYLLEVFKGSRKSIGTLQEIMGYMLLPDTSQQKAFLWISPLRGGKGTLLRTLRRLLGESNCAAPSLNSLGKDPMLMAMVDKLLAIISDMRLDKHASLGSIAENILRITGEDPITIDRKYKSAWSGQISARFFMLSNLPPNIPDVSGALSNRYIVLKSTFSAFGKEDSSLEGKLSRELPGIFNFAIEGWKRLKARGHFKQTPEGRKLVSEMHDAANPVAAFVKDECLLDKGYEISKESLYAAYDQYADVHGHRSFNDAIFARNLLAAVPHIIDMKKTVEGRRIPFWCGINVRIDFG